MDFAFECPNCKKKILNVPESAYGKEVLCPGCKQPMTIPQNPDDFPPEAPDLPPGIPPIPEEEPVPQKLPGPFHAPNKKKGGMDILKQKPWILTNIVAGALAVLVCVGLLLRQPDFIKWLKSIIPLEWLGCCGCAVLVVVIIVAILALQIAILAWVARDAKSRNMDSAVLWMGLVMFVPLIGLILYIFARPQGNLLQCSSCGNKRLQASAKCPHCGNA